MLSIALGVFVTIGLLLGIDKLRKRKPLPIQLRPNCLLTRYPIVFIEGPQSILYKDQYWNQIPHFLKEHGYDVLTITPQGRSHKDRCLSLRNKLADLPAKYKKLHFVIDEQKSLVTEASRKLPLEIASVNYPLKTQYTLKNISLEPVRALHKALSSTGSSQLGNLGAFEGPERREISNKYLDLAISLAELDHISPQ